MRILQDIPRRQARSNKALAVDTRVRQVFSSSCKEINLSSSVNIYGRNTLYDPILFDFKVGLWILGSAWPTKITFYRSPRMATILCGSWMPFVLTRSMASV